MIQQQLQQQQQQTGNVRQLVIRFQLNVLERRTSIKKNLKIIKQQREVEEEEEEFYVVRLVAKASSQCESELKMQSIVRVGPR
ncbi:hypothetical protein M0802_010326 [Mischocyttarus mexicanus]|nr:hypothetical protein M0802_010326 [Mischocyttarus mexicanus]